MFNAALLAKLSSVVLTFAEGIVEGEKIGRQIPIENSPHAAVCWAWESCIILGIYSNGRIYTFVFPPTGGDGIGGAVDLTRAKQYGFDMTPEEIAEPAEFAC